MVILGTNIVKAESKEKRTCSFFFAEAHPILSKCSESREQRKKESVLFSLPRRILYYLNVVKAGSNREIPVLLFEIRFDFFELIGR